GRESVNATPESDWVTLGLVTVSVSDVLLPVKMVESPNSLAMTGGAITWIEAVPKPVEVLFVYVVPLTEPLMKPLWLVYEPAVTPFTFTVTVQLLPAPLAVSSAPVREIAVVLFTAVRTRGLPPVLTQVVDGAVEVSMTRPVGSVSAKFTSVIGIES